MENISNHSVVEENEPNTSNRPRSEFNKSLDELVEEDRR
jgi:hypothetical protein